MSLKVTIHDFQTNPQNRTARDGANFAYSEIVQLLRQCGNLDLKIHDFNRICRDDRYAFDVLKDCNVVISNVGPHAYLYFYLREKFQLNFRIIRDVRTALWNGYLLQESLVSPYLREEDTVIFSSIYSKELFRKIFPLINKESMFVCYPLMHFFPQKKNLPKSSQMIKHSPLIIGFVGRMTQDKNFSQALDLIKLLEKKCPGQFRLRIIGENLSPQFSLKSLQKKILSSGMDPTIIEWQPPVPHNKIWEEYDRMDVLFFPSTSNLETFGRVLIEASYWDVRILASSHAAAPELLLPDSLLPTQYFTNHSFDVHQAHQLGSVDLEAAIERLLNISKLPHGSPFYRRYLNHDQLYISIVQDGNHVALDQGIVLSKSQDDFIRSLSIFDLHPNFDTLSTNNMIGILRNFLVYMQSYQSLPYYTALAKLMCLSRYRSKTFNFIQRSLYLKEDFTNIGGIDLQMAHLIHFYPNFLLQATSYAKPRGSLIGKESYCTMCRGH